MISFSKIRYFQSCPRKYFYRYVQKILPPTPLPVLSGSAFHKASASEYERIKQGKTSKTSVVVDEAVYLFESLVEAEKSRGVCIEDIQKKNKEKDVLARGQGFYHKKVMKRKSPDEIIEVEKKFNAKLKNGIEITGVIDRIDTDEEQPVVIEMKTTKRKSGIEFYSPQLCLYQAVKKIPKGKIEVVIMKKEPEFYEQEFRFAKVDFINTLAGLKQIAETIKNLENKPMEYWWQNVNFWCQMCWYKSVCFKGR